MGGGADQRPRAEQPPGRHGVHRVETQVHAVGSAAEGEVDTTVDQQARMSPPARGARGATYFAEIDHTDLSLFLTVYNGSYRFFTEHGEANGAAEMNRCQD